MTAPLDYKPRPRERARLGTLSSKLKTIDTRSAKPPPKTVDPHYLTPEHKTWRDTVLKRAGYRCEWIENGQRCEKRAPHHRVFADHIVERQDGGAPLDPSNGQCLCGSHHTTKTAVERAKRQAR